MIRVQGVCKSFGENRILDCVTFSVPAKSVVGLAGPSGSGKSTLLKCIQGLEHLDAGSIACGGKTGFMFQDFQLFPHMTILRNLTYAPALHHKHDNLHETAMNLLGNLGIADKANLFPYQLSGGQKQRAALARSLMMGPQILLCDEPTSGLDVALTLEVATLLQSVQNRGVTMLIASHDLAFLSQIADRILIVKGGTIAIDLDPKTVIDPIAHLISYY